MYYVYGPNGFWNGGQFVSTFKEAKEFTEEAAIAFCKKRYGATIGGQVFPVAVAHIRTVSTK